MRALWLVLIIALAGCAKSTGTADVDEAPQYALHGVVVDTAIVPVAGANVSLQDGTWRLTDEDGRFRFEHLDPGFYVVRAEAPGYFGAQVNVELGADQDAVRLVIDHDTQTVAFWQSWTFKGFFECGTEGIVICALPNYVAHDVLCIQYDVCAVGNLTQNQYIEYTWLEQRPDFGQAEMFWESTQTLGSKMTLALTWANRGDYERGEITDDYDVVTGTSPIVATVNETLLEITGIGGDVAYVVRAFSGDTLSLMQDFEVVHHLFYNYAPPTGWRFSQSDGTVPEPR